MTITDFLNELNEIMQRDESLNNSDRLDNIEEFDSMSVLALMSLFDTEFEIDLTVDQVKEAETIQDLIKLANGNIRD